MSRLEADTVLGKNGNDTGVRLIRQKAYDDFRGVFCEAYNKRDFLELGIDIDFVQDNIVASKRGALRGLHFQSIHEQDKLIQVVSGRLYDVVVDYRKESPSYLEWFGFELSPWQCMFVPKGFAHGYLALEETITKYKVSDYWYGDEDSGLRFSDPQIGVDWRLDEFGLAEDELLINERDRTWEFIG